MFKLFSITSPPLPSISSASSVEMYSLISLKNSKMVSEPLVMQDDAVVTEAEDDDPDVITLSVLVLLTCTANGIYGNDASSMICMVLIVELIDYDQRSLLLLKSVETMEYPHRLSPHPENSWGSDKNRRGSTGKQPRFFTYIYLSN